MATHMQGRAVEIDFYLGEGEGHEQGERRQAEHHPGSFGDVFEDRLAGSYEGLKQALGEEQADRLQVPEENRFLGFDAYKSVLASDVDVVILTTPPVFRPQMLEEAVAAGKHVFLEKPMAVDAPGVRRVLEAGRKAKEKRLAMVAGFCWRYYTPHREAYQRIHEGAIGDVRACSECARRVFWSTTAICYRI